MKKLLFLIVCFIATYPTFSQEPDREKSLVDATYYFAQIEQVLYYFGGNGRIGIDFGNLPEELLPAKLEMKGRATKLRSIAEVLNIMSENGWEIVNTQVFGLPNDKNPGAFYLMRKKRE